MGIKPHPGQVKWLNKSNKLENLLVTGNRWGKSFACAIKIIHHAIFRIRDTKYDHFDRYHIVTASITQDQARIIFDTVVRILNGFCRIEGLVKKMTVSPYPRLEFGNGSIIEARSTQRRGLYLLGHDYDYFIFDEVAFEEEAEFVVNEVIKMRLADRMGTLDLVSTPNGRNWFYRKMKALKERPKKAYLQFGDSRENKFISKEYLQMQMEYLSEKRVAQNIMGMFVDSGGEIVPGRYVDEALIAESRSKSRRVLTKSMLEQTRASAAHFAGISSEGRSEPLRFRQNSLYLSEGRSEPLRFRQDSLYLSGWDLARKKTATVGITIEVVDDIATVVELTRIKKWDWNIILEKIRSQQKMYPGRLIIDATGLGDVVVSQLGDLNPTSFIFTGKSKAELLTNLELFHSMRKIKYARWELPDENGRVWSLEDELRSATWEDNNQCDAVMALALALWPLRLPNKPILNAKVGVV